MAGLSLIAALLGLLLFPAHSPKKLPAVPPVALSGAWTTVRLPAAPLGIAVHNGTIWVCGWDEMIAESTDSGRDWIVRNLKKKHGELLFSFAFFGKGKMAVFGSAGARLASFDGGQTWKRSTYQPALGLSEVAFADADDGYGINASQLAWTHDGGRTWSFTSMPLSPSAVAALSGSRAAIIASQGQHEFLMVTTDGGRRWERVAFPKGWNLAGLYAGGSMYRVYGSRGDGAKAAPVGAVSSDGKTWRASSHVPRGLMTNCNREGCEFGWFGHVRAWAAFPLLAPAYRIPGDASDPLTADWAATGNTLCRVSVTLRCRTGRTVLNGSVWNQGADKAPDKGPKAIREPDPKYPAADRRRRVQGWAALMTEIGKDGRPGPAIVLDAQSVGFAVEAERALRRWRFHPAIQAGKPVAVPVEILFNFHLFSR